MWKQEIEQPPPTPGLAQWAWNSLFNKETPMAKYNAMKSQPQQRAASLFEDDTRETTKEDTFHYKRASNRQPRYARDDTDYKKNVSWGGKDYMSRVRTSDIMDSDRPMVRSTMRGDRDLEFYSEKDLLPDLEDDYTFNSHRSGGLRRSRSASYLDTQRPLFQQHTSLPQEFPGRFPSPYVHKDDILSSGTKNLMTADSNAEKNKHIQVDSSPPIPHGDWKRRLGLASQAKPKSSIKAGTPLRPSTYSQRQYQMKQEKPPVSQSPVRSTSLFRRSKTFDDYSPTLDQNEVLRQLDQNALELEEITRHINKLKTEDAVSGHTAAYRSDIDDKYKRVKGELIQELKKSQKLYDSYYRFVVKYKDLKAKYEKAVKDHDPSHKVKALEKEILLLRDENQYLKDQMNEKDVKLQEDDFTLSDLKSTLQSTSNFEVTLRRKIKFLEDKLEQERQDSKKLEFQLNEKVYMMEMKAKEDEERLRKAEERIRELEAYEDTRGYDRLDKLSPLRDMHSYGRTPKRSQRPLSMGSLGVSIGGDGLKYSSKYSTSSASLHKENLNDDLHEDTIDRLIKETL